MRNRSRGAATRPNSAYYHAPKIDSPPGNQREAKRRKAHANHSPRSINKRCRLLIPRARLRAISGRARLPALRPRLSQGLPSLLSSRPCFLGLGNQAGVTRLILSQSSDSTSRLGRSTEGNDAQSRSGAGCEPARKHRTRSTLQIASGMRPSMSEMLRHVSETETNVNTSSLKGGRD
jgi:hypothetical protein